MIRLAFLLATVLAAPAYAAEDPVAVAVGRVTIVHSSRAIATLAVGDPAIADVIAEGENAVLIFGKKAGRTDLVLMDSGHRLLRKSAIVVGPMAGGDTIIVRKPGTEGIVEDSWVCGSTCAKVREK